MRGTLIVWQPTPNTPQMRDVLHQAEEFEAPVVQTEQHAHADIVDAGLHGAVERGGAPIVVALLAGAMHGGIGRAVVGFLEELVGADAGLF